jgi:hypothetical protein
MPIGRPVSSIVLTEDERLKLEELSRRRKTSQALALRARIILACAQGMWHPRIIAWELLETFRDTTAHTPIVKLLDRVVLFPARKAPGHDAFRFAQIIDPLGFHDSQLGC